MGLSEKLIIVGIIISLAGIADEAYSDIGIDISTKCKLMIQNNIDSSCPTLEQVMAVFPDTSPTEQTGDFEVVNGVMKRGPSQYDIKNTHTYFRALGDKDRVWIDPPAGIRSSIQMITIESNFEDYPIKGSYSMSNNTIVRGTERHVNFGCTDAIINAANWLFLTGDTVRYLQSGCTITNFDHIKKTYMEPTYQDIRTSYKYILEKWIEESKAKCLTICKEY